MKKYILGAILSLGLLVSPIFVSPVQAAGLTSQQISSILGLLQAFGADQAVINRVSITLNHGSFTPSPYPQGCSSYFGFSSMTGNACNGTWTMPTASTPPTNTVQNSTPASTISTVSQTSSNDWVIVFTNRGPAVPQDVRDFICGTAIPTAVQWFSREAAVYGKTKPFTDAKCIDQQVVLSGDLLNGGTGFFDGATFNFPLNPNSVINLLEQDSRIKTAKFVTVVHYMENDLQFVNFKQDSKYDFGFIRKGISGSYYPELTTDNYSEEFLHEFMHKLGATDKYGSSSTAACLTDPKTGNEYSGYDIMCHRIAEQTPFGTAYQSPSFSQLVVTDPTASEIGWKNNVSATTSFVPTITVPSSNGTSSGLTSSQISSIHDLLSAFSANSTTITNVNTVLNGGAAPTTNMPSGLTSTQTNSILSLLSSFSANSTMIASVSTILTAY